MNYKLDYLVNLSNAYPCFLWAVYNRNNKYYFATSTKNNIIESFSEIENFDSSSIKIKMENKNLINVNNEEIFAYAFSPDDCVYGTFYELKSIIISRYDKGDINIDKLQLYYLFMFLKEYSIAHELLNDYSVSSKVLCNLINDEKNKVKIIINEIDNKTKTIRDKLNKANNLNIFDLIESEMDIYLLVENIINNTNGLLLDKNRICQEKNLLLSIILYLYHEESIKNQNIYLLIKLLKAGIIVDEDDVESILDRVFNFLKYKKPSHIALKRYKECKNHEININYIIESCLFRINSFIDKGKQYKKEKIIVLISDNYKINYVGELQNA